MEMGRFPLLLCEYCSYPCGGSILGRSGFIWARVGVVQKAFFGFWKASMAVESQDRDLGMDGMDVKGALILLKLTMKLVEIGETQKTLQFTD